MATTGIGGTQARYYMLEDAREDGGARAVHWGDPWHAPTVAIVAACRTHGLLPVDGPFGDFSDDEGFRAQARRAATLGMVGKWAIHPKQIALANEVFTPSDEMVAQAKRILEAMEVAQRQGAGAVTLDGKLIDLASIRQAEVIVGQAKLVGPGG
jgi:malyl-CoA/(S)-citramalyl-CoA lyase